MICLQGLHQSLNVGCRPIIKDAFSYISTISFWSFFIIMWTALMKD